ncbi:exopolysaccharide biosynthesis protein [Stakelama sp. CBK3Z-3]|uniref:Exopolysaccharide biosynthesis protein n=1 Tax=Stakelama flava TaxID=2860338 RepID=A0ABS6XLH9_9SPHN|nr:exopolysaccharide biosynthesis protein [Stakelama flava]MBW4331046.1 exopolysaccharide biosynthesis protein [Stakelama flava]
MAGDEIEKHPLEAMADDAVDAGHDGKVTIGDLVTSFGDRGFGPMLALVGLIAATPPIGAIPGVPTSMGLLTLLMAGQMLAGRSQPWMPKFVACRGVSADKVKKARDKGSKVFAKVDALIGQRLEWAAGRAASFIVALCCLFLGLMMPPLELLPFAAMAPAAAIVMFGLALTARDGVLMILGFAATAASATLIIINFESLFS